MTADLDLDALTRLAEAADVGQWVTATVDAAADWQFIAAVDPATVVALVERLRAACELIDQAASALNVALHAATSGVTTAEEIAGCRIVLERIATDAGMTVDRLTHNPPESHRNAPESDRGVQDAVEVVWPTWLPSYEGNCPSCHEWKFIGHGPLCTDCYATEGDS